MADKPSSKGKGGDNLPLIRGIFCSLCAAGIFYYSSQHSIVFNDIMITFASIPLLICLLVEGLDRFVDKKSIYSQLYSFGRQKSFLYSAALTLLGAGLGFFTLLWALVGAFTFNVGALSPSLYVVAGFLSLYVMAPETGRDFIIFYLFIGATLAAFAQYLTIIPRW